jgi:putative MATE family efflux protein
MPETRYSYKNIWKIAFPVIVGSAAQELLLLADTAFLGHLGQIPLGAAAIGGLFYLAIVMAVWGFGVGIQVIVARKYGQDDYKAILQTISNSFVILICLALLFFLLSRYFSAHILNQVLSSDAISTQSQIFIQTRNYGYFAAFINIGFRAFFIGTGNTRIISYSTLTMALVNCLLDYLLIFGIGPFPAMGVQGSALASVIAEYIALIMFVFYALNQNRDLVNQLKQSVRISFQSILVIFKTAGPLFFQSAISFIAWFVFFLFVEKMGEFPLAISNIVRSIYMVLLIPIMGIAATANTLTSYAIGNKQKEVVRTIIHRSLVLTWFGITIIVIPVYLFSGSVISLYTQSRELIQATKPALFMVMGATYLIAFGIILFQVLAGTGHTKFSLLIESVVVTFYLLGTYLLSHNGATIEWVWIVEGFYGLGLGVLSLCYFRKFGLQEKPI